MTHKFAIIIILFRYLGYVHFLSDMSRNERLLDSNSLWYASQSVLIGKKSPNHTQFCQTWSNMKMSNNPAKYEVLIIKLYLRSILDISALCAQVWFSLGTSVKTFFPSTPTRIQAQCLCLVKGLDLVFRHYM